MNKAKRVSPRLVVLTLFLAVVGAPGLGTANEQANKAAEFSAETQVAIAAARKVMDNFMTTFNAKDAASWADTLLFPHVRIASGGVVVTPDKATFVAETDLHEFARANNWSHSQWDQIEVIQADTTKVHFKVKFSRFNPAGERYITYNSLYIVQKVGDRWGVRARSSFAP